MLPAHSFNKKIRFLLSALQTPTPMIYIGKRLRRKAKLTIPIQYFLLHPNNKNMTSSSLNIHHTRSNSFPSTSHPVSSQIEECFCRLRSSEATSTSSSSSIVKDLNTLEDLYDAINNFIQMPLTQQALSQENNKDLVDELLNGSVRLLDVCNIAKDALVQANESLHELQSILRRKRAGEVCFVSEVKKYLASRKSLKKAFCKLSKNLSKTSNDSYDNNSQTFTFLREAETVTINVFDSILSFISGSKSSNSWSLVSKLIKPKRVACEATANEFAKVDAALESLVKAKFDMEITSVQSDIQSLESCIQDLDEGFDCLFKCLIKSRVSMLNFLH